MKKYSVIWAAVMIWAACACACAEVAIGPENFPDYNFAHCLMSFDTDGDNVLTDSDIAAIKELDLRNKDISDLRGIENLTALESLDCSNNSLRVLNLESNTKLTHINCDEQHWLGVAITDSGNTAYPYQANFTDFMTSEQAARISWVQGFIFTGQNATAEVATLYSDGIAMFASVPDFFVYYYPTGANVALADMNVNIGNGVAIDEGNFPDETFRSYIAENFDAHGGDGILFASEIAAINAISVESMDIKSLQGIRYFTSLNSLSCWGNSIESLDVHGLTELEYLWCGFNDMKSLDVSGCTALKVLYCEENNISKLDVTDLSNLERLNVHENAITGTLDLHGITTLVNVNVRNNMLTSVDVHGCTALKILNARSNQLQELNITGCDALEELNCRTRDADDANHTNHITALDLSGKSKLKELICYRNSITALNLTDCTALVSVDCGRNQITSLNVAGCTELEYLVCGSNDIGTLDVSNNTKLTHLDAWDCGLSTIDVSKNTELEYLELGGELAHADTHNRLTTIDVSNNTKLTYLAVDCNLLTSIDVSMLPLLETLMIQRNSFTSIDVSNNTALKDLRCHVNDIKTLDLSANTALTYLSCYSNDITTLDLSNNPLLETLVLGTTSDATTISEVPELRLTYTPNASMPYHTDMKYYVGSDYTKITSVMGYTSAGDEILMSYMTDGTVDFAIMPVKVVYTYDTGYTGTADVPKEMKVALVPDPENFFSPLTVVSPEIRRVVSKETITVVSIETRTVGVGSSSSSGGCNAISGAMLLSLLAGLAGIFTARKH